MIATDVPQVLPYLRSRSSDTRGAAALALSHICSLLPLWSPAPSDTPTAPENASTSEPPAFPTFDLPSLLANGTLLLASSGKEYAAPSHPADLARARKDAMSRLGLDFLEGVGGADDMDWERELAAGQQPADQKSDPEPARPSPPAPAPAPAPPALVVAAPLALEEDLSGLSVRERNRLKRKRKPGNGAFVAAPNTSNAGNSQPDAAAK